MKINHWEQEQEPENEATKVLAGLDFSPESRPLVHKQVVDNVAFPKHLCAFQRVVHALAGFHQRRLSFNGRIFQRFSRRPLCVGPISTSNPRVQP